MTMDQRAQQITDGCMKRAVELLAIDSPTGYTWMAAEHVTDAYRIMGLDPEITRKGGVLVCLNPDAPEDDAVLLEAHVDTLGAMVTEITGAGRLNLTPLGGMEPNNGEGENVRVVTRSGRIYTGVFQMKNASVHVNLDYHSAKREYKSMEVVIDEEVSSREDVEKLGIQPGDIVCFDPRTRVTDSGYIKSRFLDDKLSVAILLELAARVASGEIKPSRRVWEHITVFEEVGHGGSASVPEGVTEAISVDMGCVGDGLGCDERKVSICAKDSRGPYHYEVVTALIEAARRSGADYAVDVYPAYGSDVEATLSAGHDLRHGLVGPGVYASHGYERSHRKGVCSTFLLLEAYLA